MPLEVLAAGEALPTSRDLAHVHALQRDRALAAMSTESGLARHTFCTFPSFTTCCAVGTLRPRLFFVRLGTGTGGASRRPLPPSDPELGEIDGEIVDMSSPWRRRRGD